MTSIVGISGSLRRGSYNRKLVEACGRFMPPDISYEIASIRDIPLYDADVEESDGIPQSVGALKEQIAGAAGLIIATPEYNHSIPGVAKNAIDWLSRPPKDVPRVFRGLPVAIMGATPGRGGTTLAQNAWLPILRTLGTRAWFGRSLQVAAAGEKFDANGLHDEKTLGLLEKLVKEFAEFAVANPRR